MTNPPFTHASDLSAGAAALFNRPRCVNASNDTRVNRTFTELAGETCFALYLLMVSVQFSPSLLFA